MTYQVFPNNKANCFQTIRMLENFSKQKVEPLLIFPDRGSFDKSYKKFFEDHGLGNQIISNIHK